MKRRATLSNGDAYVIDDEARTIEPETPDPEATDKDMVALIASNLMLTGDLIGPQVDDLAGIRGTWDDGDMAPVVALVEAAATVRLSVVNVTPV